MKTCVRVLFAVFLLLSGVSSSGAAPADAVKAKAYYQKATSHYAVGEYEQAAENYQEAYKLKQDPALLFNAAQSYRLAGKLDKALTIYRNYTRLYPDAANIEEVRDRITKVEEQIKAEKAAAAPPPAAPAPAPLPVPAATAMPEPSAAPAAGATVREGAGERSNEPLTSKPWFWGVVGGVVVVAVVGILLAASSGGGEWANAPEVQQGALTSGGVRW